MGQFLHIFQKSESILSINSKPNHILYSREISQENSQQGDSTRGFPFASNPETAIKPVGQEVSSSIPGFNRTLFIAVVVSSAVILSLAIFIPVYCWRRRRHNIRRRRSTLSTGGDRELPDLGEKDVPKQIYDAPRPDSTTLPIHGIFKHMSTRGLAIVRQTTGSSLGNFDEAISNQPSCSRPLIYQSRSKPRSALGLAAPPPAVLRFPTIAFNPEGNYRSPIFSSSPQAVVQFPTIASLASNSPPNMKRTGHPRPIFKASVTRNKLQKRALRELEKIPEPKPITPFPIISTFAGFGRVSTARSMSNYSASWWESNSDEGKAIE